MGGRALVVGWDGATWDLLDRLVAEGAMPNLKELCGRSAHSRMDSVVPPVTGPAWVSVATGVNPGRHGCFDFNRVDPETGTLRPIQTYDIQVKTFYEVLQERGRTAILVNLPVSYPPLTGQVTLTSLMTVGDNAVFPEPLKDELPDLKAYRVFPNIKLRSEGKLTEYVRDIRAVEAARMACVRALLPRPWDCFFVVFSGPDWVSHEAFPALMSNGALRDEALEVFRDLDGYLGELVAALGSEDHLLLVSDHGFCAVEGVLYLNELLARWGAAQLDYAPGKVAASAQAEVQIKEMEWRGSFPRWKAKLAPWLFSVPGLCFSFRVFRKFVPIEWPHRFGVDRAKSGFYMPTTASRGLHRGGVAKEPEPLRRRLLSLKDPDGRKVLDYVEPREAVYHGEHVPEAPALLLGSTRWELEAGVRSLKRRLFARMPLGAHHPEGIFLLHGPAASCGEGRRPKPILMDVAPLIFHLVGEAVPEGLDGAVPQAFLDPAWLSSHPVSYAPASAPVRQEGNVEAERIHERLRALGYME